MSRLAYHLDGVTVRYGGRTVLDLPLLDIPCGETLAVLGPSGAGKSTLLRLLNMLERPATGRITLLGQRLPSTGEAPLALRRQVTTVFQRPAILGGTVFDNVSYGLRLRGRGRDRERAMAALDRVGLAGLAGRHTGTLSGGELQRVALARALAVDPAVLLLDEPTANLDPANVQLIEAAIAAARARGVTIVLVTHNLFQARRLADQAALLLEGRIVEQAPAEQLLTAPCDPRAAAFVNGEMVY